MDVLVPDWSDWATFKKCEVRPSLVSTARVGQHAFMMRGAGFQSAPVTAVSVLGPPREQETEPEPEAAPVD